VKCKTKSTGTRRRHGRWLVCLLAGSFCLAGQSLPGYAQTTLPDAPASKTDTQEPLTIKGTPLRIFHDEVGIFTSPARVKTNDLKWLLPLAGATAASLSTDTYTMRHVVTHDASINDSASTASEVLRGTAIAAPVFMYFAGWHSGDESLRDTGFLGGEAMVDAYIFSEIVKYATLRERPYQDNARGHFYSSRSVGNPSFVSGHSIVAWSSAAVVTERYSKPWQQIGIYTLATGTSLTRVLAQDHFPTDVLLGSAAGWLIGHYVYKIHHHPPRLPK
jgi:membrane-associated phospholipid phosphatase